MFVPHSRHAQLRPALEPLRSEDVGVEELAGTHHRVPEEGARREPGEPRIAGRSMFVPAPVDQVGGAITGTATVERYIPAKYLGYRDMAPEVYGAGTINANWQEGATSGALNSAASNPHPGYGIFITGSDATFNTQPRALVSTNTISF